MSLSRVPGDDEIYISGIFSLRRPAALKEAGITHIVSALRFDYKETKGWENYKQFNVHVDDTDDENIIQYFPDAVAFITEALEGGGGVLIHCAMGKSRSVAVALAYLLATRRTLTLASALSLIRQTRPSAEPNSGFMSQLALWTQCNYVSDIESHPLYQRWLYNAEVELSTAIGRAPDRLRFEDEEAAALRAALAGDGAAEEPAKKKNLRCRKCRNLLGTEDYLVPHTPRPALSMGAAVDVASLPLPNPEAGAVPLSTTACGHLFIQPLSWMRPALETGELEGRLLCPNKRCEALVGRWNWKGLKCTCGVWVTPAFALQKGRVDVLSPEVERGRGADVAGVRMPPGMRMPPTVRMPPGMGGNL